MKREIINSAEESCDRLQADHIDSFQLHHRDDETPPEEILTDLHSPIVFGNARCIGCGNWYAGQLAKLLLH